MFFNDLDWLEKKMLSLRNNLFDYPNISKPAT